MTDDEFLRRFEDCTLSNHDFHHRDHIKVVWLYLQRYTVVDTLSRFAEALKRFASAHGKPNLYHETITWAYVFLIHERMRRDAPHKDWADFEKANPDLFDWENSLLKSYYLEETLRSDLARKTFVFPDKLYAEERKR